jgi:hypothetical protein
VLFYLLKIKKKTLQMRLSLILFFSILFGPCVAQLTPDSVASLLSGKNHKEWVASPWIPVMGGNPQKKCNGGESYTFYKDSSVEIRKCENDLVTTTKTNWKVVKEGRDNFLFIGNDKYQIRDKVGSKSEIKLRVLTGDKLTLSKEVILKYEKY